MKLRFLTLIQAVMTAGGFRQDAATEAFIDQQLEAMEAQAYKIQFVDLKARSFIPLKSDVPAGADTFAYRVLTPFGRADWMADYSDELPKSGLRGEKKVGKIEGIVNAVEYTIHDLRAAAMANLPLDSELMEAAMRAHEEKVDSAALLGDAKLGFVGLFNHPDITITTPASTWTVATSGASMLQDLHKIANKVVEQSKGKFIPDTILLPLTCYNLAAAKPVDTTGSVNDTVLTVFLRNRTDIKSIDWSIALETASAAVGRRALCYKKVAQVLQLCIPMEPVVHAPQQIGFKISRPIDSRFGGTIVRQPLAMCYMDGF